MSCNYGCATLPNHQQVTCNDYSLGGLSGVAILDCNHLITDFSNANQWNTEIAAGRARIIKGLKAEIPASSPTMVDAAIACGAAQDMLGQDTTVSWTDNNVTASNDDFYAKLSLRRAFIVVYSCQESEIRVSSDPASFTTPGAIVPMTDRERQSYAISGMFFTKAGNIPMALYTAPAGIFE